MTPETAVARAYSAIGHGCIYGLGCGGMSPQRTVPWDDAMRCDCSGFAMWAVGLSRKQGGIWYDTTRIRLDAIDGGTLFRSVAWVAAQPGDLLVYGDRRGPDGVERQGHIGIVSEIAAATGTPAGPVLVVHCSSGNWKHHSDAIREDAPGWWTNHPETVVARCISLERAAFPTDHLAPGSA